MRRERELPVQSRVLIVLTLAVLFFFSVRPVPVVDRALAYFCIPSRLALLVAAPFDAFRARRVRAAGIERAAVFEGEVERSRALVAAERRFGLPTERLLEGKRAIHAEVVSRSRGSLDRIVVRLAESEGLFPGAPVVHGENYVGRLASLTHVPPGSGYAARAEVDLVTKNDHFVGAACEGEDGPVSFVVGGLARSPRGSDRAGMRMSLALAVHHPSGDPTSGATVFVSEVWTGDDDGAARLADGFRLGQMLVEGHGRHRDWRVQPALDYEQGLYHLLVLAPADAQGPEHHIEVFEDCFEDGLWVSARVFGATGLTPGRAGLRLGRGFLRGVSDGAAVAFGAQLLGRVVETRPTSAVFSTLADPGWSVPAVAAIDGLDRPFVLGSIVSLGAREGRPIFRWEAVTPLPEHLLEQESDDGIPAVLYTGGGSAGVPPGLVIGRTRLLRRDGPSELKLDCELESPGHVSVRSLHEALRSAAGL